MFQVGFPELIVIFLAVVLLFGTKSLPEIARSMGLAVRNFRKALQEPDPADDARKSPSARPSDG